MSWLGVWCAISDWSAAEVAVNFKFTNFFVLESLHTVTTVVFLTDISCT